MRTVVLFVYGLSALSAAENVIKTKPGGSATFKCELKDTFSSMLKWQRGSDTLFTTRTGMPSRGKAPIVNRSQLNDKDLSISQIKMEDAGEFICSAKGQQELHRLVVTSVSVSPSSSLVAGSSAVLQCDVAGLTPNSVVHWLRPDGQQVLSNKVEIKSIASSDAGSWKCVFSVDGKTMKEELTIKVTAPLPKTSAAPLTTTMPKHQTPKTDMPACPIDCSDGSASATPTLGGLKWWMWAAVGGGCLVIVLLLVLVLVLSMTRRKRRNMTMRKGAQLKPNQYCQCPCPAAGPGRLREPSAPLLPPLSVHCH